ncbi:serine-rich coiled-coil domain-containing protein 2-like isoform X3 [Hippocampus comes]|uniref:serine-rich coiled-coil domain-containing protein 2-like isoform X3 n=1 Tax=Hippocampus comes TaxID=109280 RepID=UPI00094E3622|nr:PREDICTED: serine-rich coiled-coil domain-containing protein 2-like isoform X3 [Hippocampus comes]
MCAWLSDHLKVDFSFSSALRNTFRACAAPRLPESHCCRLMSAPAMPTPVSRLPKFGSWSKSSSPTATAGAASHVFPTARLPGGFYHHPGPAVCNGNANEPAPSSRRIGTIRTPAEDSTKWRKGGEVTEGGDHNDTAQQDKDAQRSAADPKMLDKSFSGHKTGLPVPKSTGLPVPKSTGLPVPKTGLSVPKNRLPVSKPRLTGSKQNLHDLSGSKLRPPKWSTYSGSTLSSSPGSGCGSLLPAARSPSTGNVGSVPASRLTTGDGFHPRSLEVRRQAPATATTLSLSTKPGHKESSTSFVQARPLEGPAGPGGVKKSLLPALKANNVSYKLSRPALAKHARTVVAEVSQARAKTPERTPESSPERTVGAAASQVQPSVPGETVEDMSLSSGSSVDHNRASQEYMDDFDDLGNGGMGVLVLATNDEDDSGLDRSCSGFCEEQVAGNGVSVATELHFLDSTLDWTHGTPVGNDGPNHLTRFSYHSRTSPSDDHEQGGSSLDLSPSDSCGSGGIYMWDEEGLEPLGGAVSRTSVDCGHVQRVGSFDSDVNSSDALTNVDSCDLDDDNLDDDDLMLDGDFPDDISLHTADGDGTSRMAEWRRRQLCWGTQDVHSDDREAGCYDEQDDTGVDTDLALDLSPQSSAALRTPGVDMEDLADDCGALRSQLELLRRFLLQDDDTDDDTLTTDTLSPEEGEQSQVEALLQEVQQLKEDLRSKERIISELTLQLAVASATSRCHCPTDRLEQHTQTNAVEPANESVASQTPWSERTAFPPSTFLSPPWQYQRSRPYGGRPKPSIPSHLARKTTGTSPPPPGRAETTSHPASKQKLRPSPGSAHPAPPSTPRPPNRPRFVASDSSRVRPAV